MVKEMDFEVRLFVGILVLVLISYEVLRWVNFFFINFKGLL